jgi:molybdate/tungstate transport system substrate-binding protein
MTGHEPVFSVILAFLIVSLELTAGCLQPGSHERTPVRVLAAGSVLMPLEQVETGFEAIVPDADIQIEGHGSIQVIRQVTDLHRRADVVIVADEYLIPDMMYQKMDDGERNFTDGYIPFATNAMVLAYTNKSRYADEIDTDNWRAVLERPDVRIGFSNPMLDAAGYRALMVTMLAEEYYRDPDLFNRLIGSHFSPPLGLVRANGTMTVTLPPVLKPSDGKVAVRDGSIYLMSLLDAGGLDYAFEYQSVADGQGLHYVELPVEIDLSSAAHAGEYEKAQVVLGFERFNSLGKIRTGTPIVYAITVPNNAPHTDLAYRFMNYTLAAAQAGGSGWPKYTGQGT